MKSTQVCLCNWSEMSIESFCQHLKTKKICLCDQLLTGFCFTVPRGKFHPALLKLMQFDSLSSDDDNDSSVFSVPAVVGAQRLDSPIPSTDRYTLLFDDFWTKNNFILLLREEFHVLYFYFYLYIFLQHIF